MIPQGERGFLDESVALAVERRSQQHGGVPIEIIRKSQRSGGCSLFGSTGDDYLEIEEGAVGGVHRVGRIAAREERGECGAAWLGIYGDGHARRDAGSECGIACIAGSD